ncbi:uncharacterized protein LOC110189414 isoform X2 [Drosophila serrata]|uniref:uncharacterized protein LOC110189414 isoform X2 n=1 Tax=Drosophila serrata TaxID=7274 RepID=UPI000A1D15E6|nr:uncharacterized protein LOC110189414 isoform X2 [Drosophila serrata]
MIEEMAISNKIAEEGQVKTVKGGKCFYLKKMIGDYIDTAVRIGATVFLADFLKRLYHCGVEYWRYVNYYLPEDRLWTILRRGYAYSNKSVYLIMAFLLVGFSRTSMTGDFRIIIPTATFLVYMPLYWVFSDLGHSTLTYSKWIREPHGLDYAEGMASNYFHGYIKLALPELKNDGLKHRMAVYEPLETRFINRAGVYRPFKHDVYKLTRKVNGMNYYFAIEGATPMLSFYDAMQSTLSATWQMRELKREIWLKFAKHLKKLISKCPETRNEVHLLVYSSHDKHGNLVDVGDMLIDHIRNKTETLSLGNEKYDKISNISNI